MKSLLYSKKFVSLQRTIWVPMVRMSKSYALFADMNR